MSARWSTGLPRACSGLIYAAVPRMTPLCVIAGDVIVGDVRDPAVPDRGPARSPSPDPKSSTLTVPSARTLMLAGLRSRWMMPRSCAASSASAICLRDPERLVHRNRAPRDALRERSPSTSSMTSAVAPSDLLEAVDLRDVRMIEGRQHFRFTLEPREAIRLGRHRAGSTLIATARFRLLSRRAIDLSHSAGADGARIS